MTRLELLTHLNLFPTVLSQLIEDYSKRTWDEKLLASFQDGKLVLEAKSIGWQLRFKLNDDSIRASMGSLNHDRIREMDFFLHNMTTAEFIHAMTTVENNALPGLFPAATPLAKIETAQYKAHLDAIIASQQD